MEVEIRENFYEYASDHPDGWKRSKGDFKFPVIIGTHKCFIKRFNKRPENISGWKLLNSLKGKYEQHLPRLHDVVNTKERGENIHYVFSEFIEGDTLSGLLSEHVEINLEILTEDLFSAFQSLNKYGFWFADFFEKNICRNKKGNFFLVDLDSAEPLSNAPDINMWGEKEYWILVFDFYKNILHKQNFRPSQINPVFLNYLQMIFLVLRIKLYNNQRDKDYRELYSMLPFHLNRLSSAFKEIFTKVLENHYAQNSESIIIEIKNLINEKIINSDLSSPSQPVIKQFTLNNNSEIDEDNYVVESGKVFTLNWKVENAIDIELYKNGQFFQKPQGEESIELAEEVYDRDEKKIQFELVASNAGKAVRELLTVVVTQFRPVIKEFEAGNYSEKNDDNSYVVDSEKTYSLRWNVQNAAKVKLYKNGSLLNEFNSGQNEYEVAENIYDGKSRPVEYKLVALNNSKEEARSLMVNIKKSVADITPVINEFAIGNARRNKENYYELENGKPFNLYWDTQNATKLKLYKNGNFFNEFNSNENQFEVTEKLNDNKENIIQYTLVASNKSAKTDSKSFSVLIKPNVQKPIVAEITLSNYASKNGDYYVVKSEKPFKLKWRAENASNVELLKNGQPFKTLTPGEDYLELREKTDAGKETNIKYTLVAASSFETKKNIVVVTVKKSTVIPFLAIFAVIMVGILTTIIYFKFSGRDKTIINDTASVITNTVTDTTPLVNAISATNTIFENDTIKISGKNLPEDENAITVNFNDNNPAIIIQHTNAAINVLVPHLKAEYATIKVSIRGGLPFTVADHVPYRPKATVGGNTLPVTVNPLSVGRIFENDLLTISGTNFPLGNGAIKVRFNNVNGSITRQTSNRIIVRVPALREGQATDITVNVKGKSFPVANGVIYKKIVVENVTLNPFNQAVITEDEIITITGNNIPEERGAVQVIFDGRVLFSIVEQTRTMIRARVPTLVIKSGIIAVKANGNYVPLRNSLVDYKLHNAKN